MQSLGITSQISAKLLSLFFPVFSFFSFAKHMVCNKQSTSRRSPSAPKIRTLTHIHNIIAELQILLLAVLIVAPSPEQATNNNMSVTLHSSLGDIKIEVFCDTAQRTAFNFLALCASGYYDGTSFHRNMKGFMVQGGDPTGTGKGGESIWGGKFQVSEVLSSDIRATQSWSTVSYVFIGTTGRIPC